MKRAILWLAVAVAVGLNSDIRTLDNCATDTECESAAARHCERGEAFYCEEAK